LLHHYAPRREAFFNFIQILEFKGIITKTVSFIEASKSILRMSEDARKAFKASQLHLTTPVIYSVNHTEIMLPEKSISSHSAIIIANSDDVVVRVTQLTACRS
jgi:hypothetical protein